MEYDAKIEGTITSAVPSITGEIRTELPAIQGAGAALSDIPVYDGVTEVDPNRLDLILETGRTIVAKDITVRGVPFAEVENPDGGTTVTIGG